MLLVDPGKLFGLFIICFFFFKFVFLIDVPNPESEGFTTFLHWMKWESLFSIINSSWVSIIFLLIDLILPCLQHHRPFSILIHTLNISHHTPNAVRHIIDMLSSCYLSPLEVAQIIHWLRLPELARFQLPCTLTSLLCQMRSALASMLEGLSKFGIWTVIREEVRICGARFGMRTSPSSIEISSVGPPFFIEGNPSWLRSFYFHRS